jgi:signal transduction histidine kinase
MSAIQELRATSLATRAVPADLLVTASAAAQSDVPSAIVQVGSQTIDFANQAFASFVGLPIEQLLGTSFQALSSDRARAEAVIERAWRKGVSELAPDLPYRDTNTRSGQGRCGATIVQPLLGVSEPAVLVQLVDTTAVRASGSTFLQAAVELRQANEQLVLASLREHELAERAEEATREVERLLARQRFLADASQALGRSLDLRATLQTAAELALPSLADACVVQLGAGEPEASFTLAHADPAWAARLVPSQVELARASDVTELVQRVVLTRASVSRAVPAHDVPDDVAGAAAPVSLWRSLQAHSLLALPLQARETVFGVMILVASEPGRVFGPDELELASSLARRASLALDNARLYDDARSAVRVRDDVLAIVSHDLRNPLSAISMSVQRLLKMAPCQEPQVSAPLSLIQRSSKHMRRLIEELLEVASIQTGQLALEPSAVSARQLVSEAIDLLAPLAQRRGVELVGQLDEGDLVFTCDLERVVRVLVNLAGNALKFSPRDSHVRICARAHEGGVCFEVIDQGPGVAKCDQPKLFDRYWKGDQSGRRGMGLGLYIARGIVEAHGGHIGVHSVPPHGATFSFHLPSAPASLAK